MEQVSVFFNFLPHVMKEFSKQPQMLFLVKKSSSCQIAIQLYLLLVVPAIVLKKESVVIPRVSTSSELVSHEHFNEAVQTEHDWLKHAMEVISYNFWCSTICYSQVSAMEMARYTWWRQMCGYDRWSSHRNGLACGVLMEIILMGLDGYLHSLKLVWHQQAWQKSFSRLLTLWKREMLTRLVH